MNLREIKDLINLMNEHGLNEIEIESEGNKIKLKRGETGAVQYERVPLASSPRNGEHAAEKAAPVKAAQVIKSPMVGTFYSAPAPDAEPYLKNGSKVEVGQVVCIIEAMKLMNEIKSEVKGTVVEIHATNGEPVEFGQALFSIS